MVTHGRVAAFVLFLAAVTFLVRFVQPIGTAWYNMQLCFFPQYVLLFIFGLWAARSDFLRSVPWSFGWTWLRLALFVGIPYWAILIPLGGALSGNEAAFYGGMRWQAAAYALWEAFFAVGVCLGLVVVFRERFDSRTRLSGFLSDNAFGVYVFHAPILVTISLALRPLSAPPLLKAAVVAVIAAPSCFLFSTVIRRVPGCRRLLS